MIWFCVGLIIALGVPIAVVLHRWIQAIQQLRNMIARLAKKDFRRGIVISPFKTIATISQDLCSISEHLQKQEQQINDENFSLRTILSGMVEGVMLVDNSQHILLINQPLMSMFKIETPPLHRYFAEVFIHSDLQRLIGDTFAKNQPQIAEISIQQKNEHSESYFSVYSSPLHRNQAESCQGAVVVFHDITQVKTLEAMRRDFVANVSHEFRTPLSIISGYIETLQDGALHDPIMAEKSLCVMQRHCQRLHFLIEDLLTISEFEHKKITLKYSFFSIKEILNHVIEQEEALIAEKQAEISFLLPQEAIMLYADRQRIEQVLNNLLHNALRYGYKQGKAPCISISAIRLPAEIEIRFCDEGPGIPVRDQPHLFERFYRVHKDRTRYAGGTGLGLSIAKHLILAHSGEISIESVYGEGAAFIIKLPLAKHSHLDEKLENIASPENSQNGDIWQ